MVPVLNYEIFSILGQEMLTISPLYEKNFTVT